MKCSPSSKKECESTTINLYRIFKHNYFPNNSFGNLTTFVCEFIESSNNRQYLNMIRAIECEELEHKKEITENERLNAMKLKFRKIDPV